MKIIALHTVLAPLIASGMMLVFVTGWNHFHDGGTYDTGPAFVPIIVLLVALPWALLTSTVHASIAVLAGWRHLFVALAVTLLPTPFFYWQLVGAVQFWRWPVGVQVSIVALVVVPTTVCWYLSRRWHSPVP